MVPGTYILGMSNGTATVRLSQVYTSCWHQEQFTAHHMPTSAKQLYSYMHPQAWECCMWTIVPAFLSWSKVGCYHQDLWSHRNTCDLCTKIVSFILFTKHTMVIIYSVPPHKKKVMYMMHLAFKTWINYNPAQTSDTYTFYFIIRRHLCAST